MTKDAFLNYAKAEGLSPEQAEKVWASRPERFEDADGASQSAIMRATVQNWVRTSCASQAVEEIVKDLQNGKVHIPDGVKEKWERIVLDKMIEAEIPRFWK